MKVYVLKNCEGSIEGVVPANGDEAALETARELADRLGWSLLVQTTSTLDEVIDHLENELFGEEEFVK